ncbi:uncharacterized protein LOC110707583 [Chenopodium quinoa]|uniref:uncharacterized protein LOC110707583 n=1 Tax=Chenopodium quinoa TaxID=63459 RepID=UPI000B796CDD|nr:uncharacterized protein LOC110707583 [Chenopodium quinoa]
MNRPWVLCGDFNNILNLNDRIESLVSLTEVEPFRACLRQNNLSDWAAGGMFYTWCNKQAGCDRMDRFPDMQATFFPKGLMDHCLCVINMFDSGTQVKKPFRKLKEMKKVLKSLKMVNLSCIETEDVVAEKTLMEIQVKLQAEPDNESLIQLERESRVTYAKTYLDRNNFLTQKAKVRWLKDGDMNSAFFHAVIRKRRLHNNIYSIVNNVGEVTADPKEVCKAFLEYYQGLLGTEASMQGNIHSAVIAEGSRLSDEQGLEEVLKEVLPDLIDDCQGAFVSGRSILDNILIFQDMLKAYNNKRKPPRCTIKVDLRKAYDSVSWEFIQEMMCALKFTTQFISWVMQCVTTPTFSLLLNGGSYGFFKGKKGIRQGDPMSPILFVIVMEYLSRLLKKVGKKKRFNYHQRCKELALNHLIFADDLMLFSYGNNDCVKLLIKALKTFEARSGLQANLEKTAIYFGNVQHPVQDSILCHSGFVKGEMPFR